MTSCCQRHRIRWSGATGAIARGKNKSTGYARRDRSVHAWHWICGVKPKLKAVNKPSPHCIVHGLGKPGGFTTVSFLINLATDPLGAELNCGLSELVLVVQDVRRPLDLAIGPSARRATGSCHLNLTGSSSSGVRVPWASPHSDTIYK